MDRKIVIILTHYKQIAEPSVEFKKLLKTN